jgi:sugar phosphate isomerase/epimerase
MLLTLTATCLRTSLAKGKSGKSKLDLFDLPQLTREDLGLHGINLSTDLLAGLSSDALERFRERSDKAGCASLLLIESEPQPFGDPSEATGAAAIERLAKVIQAGHLLGCSSVAVKIAAKDDTAAFQRVAERLRKAVTRAEKLDMNVLIAPVDGLTGTPERIAELLKKIGGFRVGTYPDFQTAAAASEPVAYLRRLAPYAAVVCASTMKFTTSKEDPDTLKHAPYELKPLVNAILSVGYDGTLAIDYRGTGDAKLGVIRSREVLEGLLSVQKPREAAGGEEES